MPPDRRFNSLWAAVAEGTDVPNGTGVKPRSGVR